MSMPIHSSDDPLAEPPPVGAFSTEQSETARDDLDRVVRIWLSSIRPNYRRAVRGRSIAVSVAEETLRRRHRAR
ncbi:hypothetical protein [Microcella sp.]|uniref:hypothetical protein n=1 Tax=Microcella sp. TaxID=1913979 RepID=UPI00391B3C26